MNNNTQSPSVETPQTSRSLENTPEPAEVASTAYPRKQPIPPPSEPRQYRAIGLIRGQYKPADEQLTRGTLLGEDGTEIDAVLLGRVISLIKNHLDLERSHLWVVYPRTRQQDDLLHVQIAGVWEPELLHPEMLEETEEEAPEDATVPEDPSDSPEGEQSPQTRNGFVPLDDGYFSVRGEAIFYSYEEESIIVKINQTPRKGDEKRKYFKLHLKGILSVGRPVGHFWDIHVVRQGADLIIREAHDLGEIAKKRRGPFSKGGGKFKGKGRNFKGSSKPSKPKTKSDKPNLPSKPVPKDS